MTFPGAGISNFNGAVDQVFPPLSFNLYLYLYLYTSSSVLFTVKSLTRSVGRVLLRGLFCSSFTSRWSALLSSCLPSVPSTILQTLPSPPGVSLATIQHSLTLFWPQFKYSKGSIICFGPKFDFFLSLGPLLVGLVVVNIGICFGHNAGYILDNFQRMPIDWGDDL